MRSYIRYYTIKSGFSKKEHDPNHKYNRRGRRKEWRDKLSCATNYDQFMQIEIQEPVPIHSKGTSTVRDSPCAAGVGNADSCNGKKDTPTTELLGKRFVLERAKSCVQLHHDTISVPKPSSPTRSISIHDMSNEDALMDPYQDIAKELGDGNLGFLIVQTTQRLKEARLQATRHAEKRRRMFKSCNGGGGGGGAEIIQEKMNNMDSLEEMDGDMNNVNMASGDEYESSASALKFLLSGVVKRNHLSVNDLLIQDAASVMECGMHKLSEKARNVILGYHEEVERCLEWIAESKPVAYTTGGEGGATLGNKVNPTVMVVGSDDESPSSSSNSDVKVVDAELADRINLIRKLKHNMGRTALMLSGGGAQAMYHLGTIKALCESSLYDDMEVISGTSGGSITAAMCAIRNRDELLKEVCIPTVSTDFGLNGEQKRKNIRWFPRVIDMGAYWLKHKLLVDSKEFNRCCEFYFGDFTFAEAFERTGKHVCITVSASRAENGGAQRLLLNHISTPHVTLASAVAASCALPGVMAPAKLRTKNSEGQQELFEVDGVEWIDGSVQADLPFKRISTLFNVSSYIVCQTNFHVLPFLHKAHHPNMKSLYWKIFQLCEWDIRSRALNLSRLGLFPKIFGQDISKVFKQKYHGDLTLVPRFTTLQVFGLKSLVNPDVEDMKVYLQNGQSAAWPYLRVIKEMLRLERAIDKCMNRLIEQRRQIATDNDESWDDIESITSLTQSNRPRTSGGGRETELLKDKVLKLQLENAELRKELERAKLLRSFNMSNERNFDESGDYEPQNKFKKEDDKKARLFWKKTK
jgi:Predicted esterase of the alpha-beta hydrolase superfamily